MAIQVLPGGDRRYLRLVSLPPSCVAGTSTVKVTSQLSVLRLQDVLKEVEVTP